MSASSALRFPNWHTAEQVKRNAKRLSKQQSIPLNQALDQLGCAALGLPAGLVRWADALKSLELTESYHRRRLDAEDSVPVETRKIFSDGIVVELDEKDASEFSNTGPWAPADEKLLLLMTPTLVALYAHSLAREIGRKQPTENEWKAAVEDTIFPALYWLAGKPRFRKAETVVKDIQKRNVFPPMNAWIKGQRQDFSLDNF
ncbi:MAG: hypothetical protein WDA72_01390 [Desulfomonilia bacterium]